MGSARGASRWSRRLRGDGPFVTVEGVNHPVSGAQVAIVDGGRVYVQLRPFPPGWELPGGHAGTGEDPAVCAVREVREETGLDVVITGLAGVYRWSGLRTAGDAVYVARLAGASAPRRTLEAWSHRWVATEELPRTLFPWMHQRIADALAVAGGAPPVCREQRIGPIHVVLFGMRWVRAPLEAGAAWWRRRRERGQRTAE